MRFVHFFTLAVALVLTACGGPTLKDYEHLREPRITSKPPMSMLFLEAKGTAGQIAKASFGTLGKAYYKLDGTMRLSKEAPRARWPDAASAPANAWTGVFAFPVSNELAKVPDNVQAVDPNIKLDIWKYGTVGEILHVGSYASETPTIQKLQGFIKDQGYVISGPHEEEYVKGPGMFFAGNENDYLTIIRYEVRKK